MDYFLRKGSTYSELILELIEDGHTDSESFFNDIQNGGTITFLMTEADSGRLVYTQGDAGFKCNQDGEPCQIFYKFHKDDVRHTGTYIGKFNISFEGGDRLVVPIREDLKIHILN